MYEFSKALSRKKEFVKEVTELRASDCSQDKFNVLITSSLTVYIVQPGTFVTWLNLK